MEISKFDILILFILAIALALIIGANIIYLVNKKLNDIQINVPACPIPVCNCPTSNNTSLLAEPNNVQELIESQNRIDNYSESESLNASETVESFSPNTTATSDTVNTSNNNIDINNDKVRQRPVIVTADSSPIKKKALLFKQGYTINNEKSPNFQDKITYPDADDILRYNGYGCYKNIDTKNIRKVTAKDINIGSCRPYTGKTVEGSINTVDASFFSPMTNEVNDIKSSNIQFYVPKLYMGRDPYISGVSYAKMAIGGPADVDQIGSIPVNDYDGEPVPVGAFVDNY